MLSTNYNNAKAKIKWMVKLGLGLGKDQWVAAIMDWLFKKKILYSNTVSSLLELNLQPCPLIAIFGIPSDTISLNAIPKQILAFTSLIARRTIILNWRSTGMSVCFPVAKR